MLSVHGRGVRTELHTGQTSESLLTGFRLAERDCQNPAEGCSITIPPEFLKVVEAGSAMRVNSSERQFVVFLGLPCLWQANLVAHCSYFSWSEIRVLSGVDCRIR